MKLTSEHLKLLKQAPCKVGSFKKLDFDWGIVMDLLSWRLIALTNFPDGVYCNLTPYGIEFTAALDGVCRGLESRVQSNS